MHLNVLQHNYIRNLINNLPESFLETFPWCSFFFFPNLKESFKTLWGKQHRGFSKCHEPVLGGGLGCVQAPASQSPWRVSLALDVAAPVSHTQTILSEAA